MNKQGLVAAVLCIFSSVAVAQDAASQRARVRDSAVAIPKDEVISPVTTAADQQANGAIVSNLEMPDFVGSQSSFQQAQEELRKRHRLPDEVKEEPSALPRGTVIGQQPPAGADLRTAGEVVLTVSNGAPPPPSADVSITVGLSSTGPWFAGDVVKYTVLLTNVGPDFASQVRIDAKAPNLTFTSFDGLCVTWPCEIASLESNITATINTEARINKAGPFEVTLKVAAVERDPNTANNVFGSGAFRAAANPPPPVRADISVTIIDDPNEVRRTGEPISYRIKVRNEGPDSATNVRVTESTENMTVGQVDDACSALPCTIASIPAGADAFVDVGATLGSVGAFRTLVQATAAEQDPAANNNSHLLEGMVVLWPPIPWEWIVFGLIVLSAVGAAATQSARKRRWRRLVAVTSSLDSTGSSSVGPVEMAAPPLEIESWIEMGNAMPMTPIRVTTIKGV